MTVHVAGQKFQAELTNEKKNYRFSFHTAADLTDKNISFDLGLGTTVYLDDVRIDEDSLIKTEVLMQAWQVLKSIAIHHPM